MLGPLSSRVSRAVGKAQYRTLRSIARRVAGFEPRSEVIEGVRVPFFIRGHGPPLLLVHGFGGDKESFLVMASKLARRRTIVIPDMPGFGEAGLIEPERASAREQARVLAKLLDALGFHHAHFAGNSMGGGISMRFAQDYPERARSITLIGSVGPVVDKSEAFEAFERGENPLVLSSPEDLPRLLTLVATRLPPSTRAMRSYIGADRFARAPGMLRLFGGWAKPVAGAGVPEDLRALRLPALVIHGDRDRVIHPSTGRALAAQLPNARLEILRGIGHIPQMEVPAHTANLVDAFVDSVERASLD